MPAIKRLRPVTSCLSCRKRRVRCDRAQPSCGRCVSSSNECVYDSNSRSAFSSRSVAQDSDPYSFIAQQLEQDQSIFAQGLGKQPDLFINSSNQELGQLSTDTGGRASYSGPTYWANSLPPELEAGDAPDGGVLSQSKTRSGDEEGQAPWLDSSNHSRSRELVHATIPCDKCSLCGRRYSLACIVATLPSREVCDSLCGIFFSTVFPLSPIFHLRSFAADLQDFWADFKPSQAHDVESNAIIRKKPGFICLLSSILFAALASASKPRIKDALQELEAPHAGNMYFLSMTSATLTGFPQRPSIYSLAGFILAQSIFVREEDFATESGFIAIVFRVAIGMGLHRQFSEDIFTVAETETRRRLWWYIIHFDVMSSASSGLAPLFLNEEMANTKPICHYDRGDDEIETNRQVDVRYLVASYRYAVTKEIRSILKCHFESRFHTLEHVNEASQTIAQLEQSMKPTIDALIAAESVTGSSAAPRTFDRTWTLPPDPGDQEVINFSSWAALLLHLMIHKAYCVLYRPLFRDPSMGAHEKIRASAVHHAQAFIQLFIRVCDDTSSESFHWLYPGVYQPLEAVALVLADFLRRPYGDEVLLSRGLVDAMLELYQSDEGIVGRHDPLQRRLSDHGKAAWSMLLSVRRRALQQIGADHHVLSSSTLVSSAFCLCGERISNTGPEVSGPNREGMQDAAIAREATPGVMFGEQPQEETFLGFGAQESFDWHDWDTVAGPSFSLS